VSWPRWPTSSWQSRLTSRRAPSARRRRWAH
jgi:hypothetical protein